MLRRFLTLTSSQRRLVLEAGAVLTAARIALAILPFDAVRRGVETWARLSRRRRPPDAADIEQVRWAIAALGRRLPEDTCLPEAVAGLALLRRRGHPATLQIGVRDPGGTGTLDAHAWTESAGQVVTGDLPDLARYRPLAGPGERVTAGFARLLRHEPVGWAELGLEPGRFLDACVDADLVGLVHDSLARNSRGWPAAARTRLARLARAAVGTELLQGREAARALEALGAAGIPTLLFKGTALAYTGYPRPSLRPRNDTDLLVRPADAPRARAVLEGIGYVATNYSGGEVLFRQFELQFEDTFGLAHALDVHWSVSTQAVFADLFDFDEVARESIPVPALGAHARAFGPVHALLLACVHPAMHHRNEERLIWLYDVHLLAARLTPARWERLADLAVTRAVAAVCLHGLTRARARLGTSVPESVLVRLGAAARRAEPSARYLEADRRWGSELASSWGALRWRERLALLREIAFPSPSYMLAAYGVTNSRMGPWLLPALYAHRGIRGLWKVTVGRK